MLLSVCQSVNLKLLHLEESRSFVLGGVSAGLLNIFRRATRPAIRLAFLMEVKGWVGGGMES